MAGVRPADPPTPAGVHAAETTTLPSPPGRAIHWAGIARLRRSPSRGQSEVSGGVIGLGGPAVPGHFARVLIRMLVPC